MVDVRQRLGFSGTKPAVPALLASLLKEAAPPAVKQESAVVETIMSGPLDFEGGLEGGPGQMEHISGAAAMAPAIALPDDAEEDFSLLDLSDEELDLLIDKGAFATSEAKAGMQQTGNALDEGSSIIAGFDGPASAVSAIKEPAKAETGVESVDSALDLVFEPDDYTPELKDKTAISYTGDPDPEFTIDLPGFEERLDVNEIEFEALPNQAGSTHDESKDDFVIELSEDDLDSLLVELSHPAK